MTYPISLPNPVTSCATLPPEVTYIWHQKNKSPPPRPTARSPKAPKHPKVNRIPPKTPPATACWPRCWSWKRKARRISAKPTRSTPESSYPPNPVEFGLVDQMVAAQWRMMRIWAIQTRNLEQDIDNAPNDLENHIDLMAAGLTTQARRPEFTILDAHENRLQRAYDRAIRTLNMLREKQQKLRKRTQEVIENTPTAPKPPALESDPCSSAFICGKKTESAKRTQEVVENTPTAPKPPALESRSVFIGVHLWQKQNPRNEPGSR